MPTLRTLVALALLAGLLAVPWGVPAAGPSDPPGAAPLAAPAAGPLVAPAGDDAGARQVVRELPRATAVNDADGDKVWDTLEARFLEALPGAALGVVVSFVHDTDEDAALAAAQRVAGPFEASQVYRLVLPGFAARLTLAQVMAVAALPEVRQVEWDHPGDPELETATVFMGADHVVDDLGFDGDRDGDPLAFTPEDVVIAILDTGFHAEHQDLDGGKVMHFLDLGHGETEAYDTGSHGTHVASIAAGTGDADAQYRGVAPGAAVVGIQITGPEGSLSYAIAGYEWIVANKETYGIDIATMSFGFGFATDGTSALELAVDAAWDAGVVCFKSNGNSGPERGTMTIPAAARGILGVGAMLDPGGQHGSLFGIPGTEQAATEYGFLLARFSSRGPTTDGRVKPDLAAPGVSIMAAQAGTTDGYVAFSGTSMAAPFAAGTTALVLDANPALTPDEVRDVLTVTAEDWGVEGKDVDYGGGRIQVAHAVAEALRRAGQPVPAMAPVVPYHEVRTGHLMEQVPVPSPLPLPFGVPLPGVGVTTIEVEDVTHPFAVTAIVEGRLATFTVDSPGGERVVSLSPTNQLARQHEAGFVATQPGTYTLTLVGQPGAFWVVDVVHGTAGGVAVALPGLPLEGETVQPAGTDRPTPGPSGWAAALAFGIAALGAAASRRRGPPRRPHQP